MCLVLRCRVELGVHGSGGIIYRHVHMPAGYEGYGHCETKSTGRWSTRADSMKNRILFRDIAVGHGWMQFSSVPVPVHPVLVRVYRRGYFLYWKTVYHSV